MLRNEVEGARVLDLFGGSGALAIEALSRGAQGAVVVERSVPALKCMRRNLDTLGLSQATVIRGDAWRMLARGQLEGPFDLIFADPPYGTEALSGIHDAVAPVLASRGLLLLECESGSAPGLPAGLGADGNLEPTQVGESRGGESWRRLVQRNYGTSQILIDCYDQTHTRSASDDSQ